MDMVLNESDIGLRALRDACSKRSTQRGDRGRVIVHPNAVHRSLAQEGARRKTAHPYALPCEVGLVGVARRQREPGEIDVIGSVSQCQEPLEPEDPVEGFRAESDRIEAPSSKLASGQEQIRGLIGHTASTPRLQALDQLGDEWVWRVGSGGLLYDRPLQEISRFLRRGRVDESATESLCGPPPQETKLLTPASELRDRDSEDGVCGPWLETESHDR